MINVLEFLQVGVIHEVVVGMKKDNVFEIIKNIEDEILLELPNHQAFAYEGIEFVFYEQDLKTVSIQIENQPVAIIDSGQERLKLSYDTTVYEVIETLNKIGIVWEFYQPFCIQRQIAIMTEGEVLLFFTFGTEGKMEKIERRIDAATPSSLRSRLRATQQMNNNWGYTALMNIEYWLKTTGTSQAQKHLFKLEYCLNQYEIFQYSFFDIRYSKLV